MILETVARQKAKKLLCGGFDLCQKKFSRAQIGEYKKIGADKEVLLGGPDGDECSTEKIEKLFWNNLGKAEHQYSLDNKYSLFGDDVNIWNLNRFTDAESNIHGKTVHEYLNVSKLNYVLNILILLNV